MNRAKQGYKGHETSKLTSRSEHQVLPPLTGGQQVKQPPLEGMLFRRDYSSCLHSITLLSKGADSHILQFSEHEPLWLDVEPLQPLSSTAREEVRASQRTSLEKGGEISDSTEHRTGSVFQYHGQTLGRPAGKAYEHL